MLLVEVETADNMLVGGDVRVDRSHCMVNEYRKGTSRQKQSREKEKEIRADIPNKKDSKGRVENRFNHSEGRRTLSALGSNIQKDCQHSRFGFF